MPFIPNFDYLLCLNVAFNLSTDNTLCIDIAIYLGLLANNDSVYSDVSFNDTSTRNVLMESISPLKLEFIPIRDSGFSVFL